MQFCSQGHAISTGEETCEHGHGPAAIMDINQTLALMQQQMQQMMALQSENMQLKLQAQTATKVKRPDRPIIEPDASDNDWALFMDSWERYKSMSRLSEAEDIRNELRAACATEVNRLLFDFVGPDALHTASEQELLAHIKSVSVRGVHKEVHRQQFFKMMQAEEESITHYVARLKAQATLCEFKVECTSGTCNSQVSYAEDMISTQMVAGLRNQDHQTRVLAEAATLISFKQKFDRIMSLETTDTSTSKLNIPITSPSTGAAQQSAYQRQKQSRKENRNVNTPQTNEEAKVCNGCGRNSHGTGKSMARKDCPAINQNCLNCGIKGHFKRVCRQLKKTATNEGSSNAAQLDEDISFMFVANSSKQNSQRRKLQRRRKKAIQRDLAERKFTHTEDSKFAAQLRQENRKHWSGSRVASNQNKIVIPHGVWKGDEFHKQAPAKSPMLPITVTIMNAAHQKFGRRWVGSHKEIHHPKSMKACADTGAQTCTSGPEILELLKCPDNYLVPTSHKIHGITDTDLDILGAILLRIDCEGRSTRQIVYVSSNTTGLFLSETALKDLGVLSHDFPKGNSFPMSVRSSSATCENTSDGMAPCGCPTRAATPALPSEIPFEGIKENRGKLEKWILGHFASSAFNRCPHQPLQAMTGKPLDVTFKPDASPVAAHSPIPVPHHWKKEVKAGLDKDIELGIIEPLPQGVPTEWCARMVVVVTKKDGSPRRTVDLKKLNDATLRETHHTPSPFNQANVVPPRKTKTVLDAWNGYHSLPLSPKAQNAMTFITEWGRYRYLRAPMGFHGSGDGYTRRFDDISAGTERTTRCVDDSLLWDDNVTQSFWHTIKYIKWCADNGIVFNPEKFHFAEEEIEFAGFMLTEDGYKPPERVIDAIRAFPSPTSVTGVRSWFGLINQVAYSFAQAKTMAPFRDLLSTTPKKKKFYWDDTLENLFQDSKEKIIHQILDGVKAFETHRPTCIASDWCKLGIGFFLLQKHCQCAVEDNPYCGGGHWKTVFAGSRFTKGAEPRYAPVEGEALAVVHALESCRMFVLGCPKLIVAVDHKPLIPIFNDKELGEISNPRLLSLKERTMQYQFRVIHVSGKSHAAPDATSRNPADYKPNTKHAISAILRSTETEKGRNVTLDADDGLISNVMASFHNSDLRAVTWDRVAEAAAMDTECIDLCKAIQDGFPESRNGVPEHIRQYWPMRDELYIVKGVPFKGNKMLIPRRLRKEVLEGLHAAHQGINGMLANARTRLFWPGLDAQLRQVKAQCRRCREIQPSQAREPLSDPPQPEFPFQQTVTDLFDIKGNDYVVYADRYTGWIEAALLRRKTAQTINNALRRWYCTYGVPDELSSDGGPPFQSSEYRQFNDKWGVRIRVSSAHYPQSNGRAEAAVKAVKRILTDNTDSTGNLDTDGAARAMMLHRNTPVQDVELSPSVMLFGHQLNDHLPSLHEKIRAEWSEVRDVRETAMARRHMRSQQRHDTHTKCLPPLHVGDSVTLQNQSGNNPKRWNCTGTIVEDLGNRQYHVKIDGSGRVTKRNRRFLKFIDPVQRILRHSEINAKPQLPHYTPLMPPAQKINTGMDLDEQNPEDLQHNVMDDTDLGDIPNTPNRAHTPPVPRRLQVENTHPVEIEENAAIEEHQPQPTPPRRSMRNRRAPVTFSPRMKGQSHV